MKAQQLKDEFNRAPVLHLLLRYTQAMITQMLQTALCNRHHSLDQQLCGWLLLSRDRLQGDELVMTQELIANMLGVSREGVTEAALKLQHAGLIRYARGHITVLDRAGLEKRSCECYAVVRKECDRLLPPGKLATWPSYASIRPTPGWYEAEGQTSKRPLAAGSLWPTAGIGDRPVWSRSARL
jgi:hypothetical protein